MVSIIILEPSLGDFFKIQLLKGLSKNFFEDVKEYTLLIKNLKEQQFNRIVAKLRNALEKLLRAIFHIARDEERIDQQDPVVKVIPPLL
jgi:DNA-binding transcriptional regulator GbsR (MarR family)